MPANFDRIARPYRWLEYLTLGPLLQRCRTYFLGSVSNRTHALVLGDGDGRFLAKLFAANPLLRATAVDTSAIMLRLLRQRCERAAHSAKTRVRTCNHSALEHAPSANIDLVVAHFFFDCLTQPELDTLIARLAAHVRPDALWLVSEFRIPEGPMRLPALTLVRMLYGIFHVLTGLRVTNLPDFGSPLRIAGLRRIDRHLSLGGLLTTELWQRTESSD